MKRIIRIFFLLLFAILIGLFVHQDTSTVLIALKDKTIEMPLWFTLLLLLVGYFLCRIFFKLLSSLLHIKQSVRQFCRRWREKRAQTQTRRGLIEYSEGNWQRAENYFARAATKSISDNDASLLNYLVAARSAQELGASERRDDYLREAQKMMPEARIAIGLTQAQLQIVDEQWEQALATLTHLQELAPYHAYILKLLIKVYSALEDWAPLEACLAQIRRQSVLETNELAQLEDTVYSGLLMQVSQQEAAKMLTEKWESFPKNIRKRETLIILYVKKLLDAHAYREAEVQCRKALKREWNNALIALYGQCNVPEVETQLRFVENFLKYFPNNPYLLATLGRIYLRRQLWGKAKNMFLKSIQIQPDARVYEDLGSLLEKLNEHDEASRYYKSGLELSLRNMV